MHPKLSISNAGCISSSSTTHIQLIFFFLFLYLWMASSPTLVGQKAVNHSSPLCFTANQSQVAILYLQKYLHFLYCSSSSPIMFYHRDGCNRLQLVFVLIAIFSSNTFYSVLSIIQIWASQRHDALGRVKDIAEKTWNILHTMIWWLFIQPISKSYCVYLWNTI